MSTRLLVTGATGFIGSALVARLTEDRKRWSVRAAVRETGTRLPRHAEPVAVGGFGSLMDWSGALDGVDRVIHLAGRAHVPPGNRAGSLSAYRLANVIATMSLAEQSARVGVRRLVFVSSVKVNGEATRADDAFTEDDPIPTHDDPYARSKLEAEQHLRELAKRTGLEVVIIRPPLVYGPGAKANLAALMRAIDRGIPLPLGAIRNRRSLVGLENLLDFIGLCVDHPAAANETFLISDGEDLSTPELARRLATAMNRQARLLWVPTPVLRLAAAAVGRGGLIRRLISSLRVDSSKARRVLDWRPRCSVDDGLAAAAAAWPRRAPMTHADHA